MGKSKFTLQKALGKPYGSRFDVVGNSLVPVPYPDADEDDLLGQEAGEDNRSLEANQASQGVSTEEIRELKAKGVEGEVRGARPDGLQSHAGAVAACAAQPAYFHAPTPPSRRDWKRPSSSGWWPAARRLTPRQCFPSQST